MWLYVRVEGSYHVTTLSSNSLDNYGPCACYPKRAVRNKHSIRLLFGINRDRADVLFCLRHRHRCRTDISNWLAIFVDKIYLEIVLTYIKGANQESNLAISHISGLCKVCIN